MAVRRGKASAWKRPLLKACPSSSGSDSASSSDEADTREKLGWPIGVGKNDDWNTKARKVTLKRGSHQPGWKREMERSLNISEEEGEKPVRSNRFLKQAIGMLVEAFKNLQEQEADPCYGSVTIGREEEKEEIWESELVNPGPSMSTSEAAGVAAEAATPARVTPAGGVLLSW